MTITDEQLQLLFEKALEASKHAYIPYSHFPVGAALLTEDGNIITGANIENRSFGLTNCAERSAIFTAASQGVRTFIAIAIATPASDYPVGPCGAVSLRQFTRTCIERRHSLKSAISALTLNVPCRPLWAKMQNENAVTSADGKAVTPEQV